ncbi:natterin-3-like [Erpetoichthys calabaricus]|uniref:natterin-3-like n=1 Tax=Erpetoichthys calabaricus TaxID=27687 RepID=UPI0022345088|nr:natterin-3-like [Erpetoichthys calabaricus]
MVERLEFENIDYHQHPCHVNGTFWQKRKADEIGRALSPVIPALRNHAGAAAFLPVNTHAQAPECIVKLGSQTCTRDTKMMWTLLTALTFLLLSDVCSGSASMASPVKNPENITQVPEAEAVDLPVIPILIEVNPPPDLNSSFMFRKASAQRSSLDSSSVVDSTVNLQWVPFTGSVPSDTVSMWNYYASRTDYVCKVHCEPGFYSPSKGSRCFYAYGGKEHYSSSFDILVNRDHFEFLQWVSGKYGSIPSLPIRSCEGYDAFVGKNRYGLGKVVPKHTAFFLPWEGYEYFYKDYDVLSINPGSYSQKISNVIYDTNQMNFLELPPDVLRVASVDNHDCQSAKKSVTLVATTTNEKRWGIQRSTMYGVSVTITAGIPELFTGSVSVSTEKTFTTTLGETSSTSDSHSLSVAVTVQPNHFCRVMMVGKKVTADIPYTARLSRTYWNGKIRSTTVVGKYQGVKIGEVKAVIQRCEQIPDAQPCPTA